MLIQPTLEQLRQLKLFGMLRALEQQLQTHDVEQLSFDERFGMLLDHELTERSDRRLQYRLRKARLGTFWQLTDVFRSRKKKRNERPHAICCYQCGLGRFEGQAL